MLGNEEEQLVSLLLSKGAAESALADEMGHLKVQEEVRVLWHHPPTITYVHTGIARHQWQCCFLWKPCFSSVFAPDCNCRHHVCQIMVSGAQLHHLAGCATFSIVPVQLQVIRNHRLEREADYAARREQEWERALEEEAQRHRSQFNCAMLSGHCGLCLRVAVIIPMAACAYLHTINQRQVCFPHFV